MRNKSYLVRSHIKPDDSRETWGFLHLTHRGSEDPGNTRIEGWCIGYGNRETTTRVECGALAGTGEEIDLLRRLNDELKYCRDNGILLVVYDHLSIRHLRTHLLCTEPDLGVSLREVNVVALKQELSSQFSGFRSEVSLEQTCEKVGARISPEEVERHMPIPVAPDDGDTREALTKVLLLRGLYLRIAKIYEPQGKDL